MGAAYTTRVGASRRRRPVTSYNALLALPTREAPDDGEVVCASTSSPTCPDCTRGTLQWAEAGYTAWHRICDVCGSHWELHPVTFFQCELSGPWLGTDPSGVLRPVAELAPTAIMAEAGVSYGRLLALVLSHGAVSPNSSGQRIAAPSWARRARFY